MTTAWARLTWQVPDPAVFAPALATRLGAVARPGGLVAGAIALELAGVVLEIRPWIRETAADDPRAGGRLMLEPVPGGDRDPIGGGAGTPEPAGLALAGVGWATVDLERAEEELGQWLGAAVPGAAADPHLGAAARVRAGLGLPGERFVLLEPNTEGRVAASLARDGEGPCALYLRPAAGLSAWSREARARGIHLGARRAGPLGPSVIVLGGPAAGPHLLLVGAPPATIPEPAASTIDP